MPLIHHPPLSLSDDQWAQRWLVFPSWQRLHRVSEIDLGDEPGAEGVTVCGRRGFLAVPGILSRMGAPRCAHCCRLLGIPEGDGAPYNSGEEWRSA